MKKHSIQKSTLQFLSDLAQNNNRFWFEAHKEQYAAAHLNMCDFADSLIAEMNKHDDIETESGRKSLYRIYKDVRFSKDKSPYNPRFAMGVQRATRLRRGGYHLSIKPGNSFLGCGFFAPVPSDLKRIREDISSNHELWRKLLRSKGIRDNFDGLEGDQVLTAPRGFAKDDPAIGLLRHRQFVFRHRFTDAEVTSDGFDKKVSRVFKSLRPWLDHMSEVLTTDLNGESLL